MVHSVLHQFLSQGSRVFARSPPPSSAVPCCSLPSLCLASSLPPFSPRLLSSLPSLLLSISMFSSTSADGKYYPHCRDEKAVPGTKSTCLLPSQCEKWWERSLDFAEAHNPLEGRSHVWVIFVSPVPGWTYDSVKVPVPC